MLANFAIVSFPSHLHNMSGHSKEVRPFRHPLLKLQAVLRGGLFFGTMPLAGRVARSLCCDPITERKRWRTRNPLPRLVPAGCRWPTPVRTTAATASRAAPQHDAGDRRGRGRRRRDRRQAIHAGARGAPLCRGRRARHPATRRPAARQCRSRLGRFRRGPQGRQQARPTRGVRARPAESAPPGIRAGAQAQLPDETADRRATSSPPRASSA